MHLTFQFFFVCHGILGFSLGFKRGGSQNNRSFSTDFGVVLCLHGCSICFYQSCSYQVRSLPYFTTSNYDQVQCSCRICSYQCVWRPKSQLRNPKGYPAPCSPPGIFFDTRSDLHPKWLRGPDAKSQVMCAVSTQSHLPEGLIFCLT